MAPGRNLYRKDTSLADGAIHNHFYVFVQKVFPYAIGHSIIVSARIEMGGRNDADVSILRKSV